jgi:hypothetical protein
VLMMDVQPVSSTAAVRMQMVRMDVSIFFIIMIQFGLLSVFSVIEIFDLIRSQICAW